jgi:hypothetical protein
MICKLVCSVKIRRGMALPLLFATRIGWNWLADKCYTFSIESIPVQPQ